MSTLDSLLQDPSELLNPTKRKHLLANTTWPKIQDYLKRDQRILIPIGSTEQHGPDGILGVDHITATGIAYAVSDITGILCAPPLNYGMAMHHLGFPGTMALRPTTYINIVIDLLRSIQRAGFKTVYVINGHGGNKGPFLNAMQECGDEFAELEIKFINWWVMPKLEKEIIQKYFGDKEGYHATPTEISVTMSLIPGSMQLPESYSCPGTGASAEDATWVMPAKFRKLYSDGVMKADYSLATAEIGTEALKVAIAEIVDLIRSN